MYVSKGQIIYLNNYKINNLKVIFLGLFIYNFN